MKKQLRLLMAVMLAFLLNACLLSSTSPVGVNCIPGTPFQVMPVACIGL
jgi:hypothetical protein